MLNRSGLIDMDKILREQGEEMPAGGPPPEEGPPPPPEEDPDEKVDKVRDDSNSSDLADFRKEHSDIIYRIAHTGAGGPQDFNRNAEMRSLQRKFETSGVDDPFFLAFDPQTSGLSGTRHLSMIASLSKGSLSGGRIKFQNSGAASTFAEKVPEIRDDLAFEVSEQDPTVVSFTKAQEEQPEEQPPPPMGGQVPPPQA